jgi:hypothetical protein
VSCTVESDDKDFLPVTKKMKGEFANVRAFMGEVASRCTLEPESFRMEVFDSEHQCFVELDGNNEDLLAQEEDAGKQKRKRESDDSTKVPKKIKLKLVRAFPQQHRRASTSTQMGQMEASSSCRIEAASSFGNGGVGNYGVSNGGVGKFGVSNGGVVSEAVQWHLPPHKALCINSPTFVYCHFTLEQLNNIDSVACTACVRLEVMLYWDDPRLKNEHELLDLLPETLWAPSPCIEQAIQGSFDEDIKEFTRMTEEEYAGHVFKVVQYGGTIKLGPMSLYTFPFDHDDIAVTFIANAQQLRNGARNASYKTDYRLLFRTPQAFEAILESSSFRASETLQVQGFSLRSVSVRYINRTKAHDQLYFQLNVTRNWTYYVQAVIVPLVFMFFLNIAGLALDVTALNERLTHSTTLFLSAFTLRQVITPDLPKISYLTPIDRLILVTTFLPVLTGIHAILLYKHHAILLYKQKNLDVASAACTGQQGFFLHSAFFAELYCMLLGEFGACMQYLYVMHVPNSPAAADHTEYLDTCMEILLLLMYVLYFVVDFLPRWLSERAWLQKQYQQAPDTEGGKIMTVGNTPLVPEVTLVPPPPPALSTYLCT